MKVSEKCTFTEVDMDTWERKPAFDFFSGESNPCYMVTFRQDVTGAFYFARRHGVSFYFTMAWLCTQAINSIENFHYAVEDGKVYRLSARRPSLTYLPKGTEQFKVLSLDNDEDIFSFIENAKRTAETQKEFIVLSKETDDHIFLSCVPWIDITAVTNERDAADGKAKDDTFPRITWGKFNDEDGKKVLGISIEVNHRFIDGYHIGKFAENFTSLMNSLR